MRLAHNEEIGGSNPLVATNITLLTDWGAYLERPFFYDLLGPHKYHD